MELTSQQAQRLRFYRRQLEKNPPMYTALRKALDTAGSMTPDEALYLHVFGPAITSFAVWVLRQAQRDGKDRLYFLARDAWPVYLAAKAVCAVQDGGPECRYLHVSRFALRLPEYRLMGADCVDHICTGGIGVTLRRILARGGINEEEIRRTAEELGQAGQMDHILSYPEIRALKKPLRSCAFFLDAVQRRSEAAAPAAMGYLAQEGLLDDVSCALVDSGWIGTQQQTLERLLRTRRPEYRADGYYFGLYEIPPRTDRKRYKAFYFSPLRGISRKVRFSNCLFEAVCSAPEGMTAGYRRYGTEYQPVKSPLHCNAGRLNNYTSLLRRYASLYAETGNFQDTKPCCTELFNALMGSPQAWEAEAFGNLMFSDDMLEQSLQEVAARLTDRDLRNLRLLPRAARMTGLGGDTLHESAWPEGTAVLLGTKADLIHIRLYKRLLYLRKAGKYLCERGFTHGPDR